jgi:hypothetical protein
MKKSDQLALILLIDAIVNRSDDWVLDSARSVARCKKC